MAENKEKLLGNNGMEDKKELGNMENCWQSFQIRGSITYYESSLIFLLWKDLFIIYLI